MKIILKREGQRAQQLAFCFDKQLRLARESILSLIKFDLNKIENKSREYSVQSRSVKYRERLKLWLIHICHTYVCDKKGGACKSIWVVSMPTVQLGLTPEKNIKSNFSVKK